MTCRKNISNLSNQKTPLHRSKYHFFHFLWFGLLLVFLLVACTPDQINTAQFPHALTTTTGLATPGLESNPLSLTPTPYLPILDQVRPVNPETRLYAHSQGLFSVQVPADWSAQLYDTKVSFLSPQPGTKLDITVINTGYPFLPDAFSKFVDNQEKRKAIELEGYIELEQKNGPEDHSIIITHEYYANDAPVRTVSYYLLKDRAVGILDFSADPMVFSAYQGFIESILPTFQVDPLGVSKLPIYAFGQAKRFSDGYFSILTPPYWEYNKTETQTAIVETYTSPDETGIIQLLIFDDGKPVSRRAAGELALTLLRENYTRGIIILEDRVLQDRREMLVWTSQDKTYEGKTSFDIHQTGIIMLTLMWSNDPEGYIKSLLEEVFLSYMVEDQPG